jgi:hypothetical protein
MRDCSEKGLVSGLLECEILSESFSGSEKTGSVIGYFPEQESVQLSNFDISSEGEKVEE